MNGPQKWLILSGLMVVLAGLILGGVENFLVGHETLLAIKDSYREAFAAAAEGDSQVSRMALERGQTRAYQSLRVIDVHTHLIKMASLVILVGIIYPFWGGSPKTSAWLAMSLLTSAWLFPLGVLAEIFSRSLLPQAAATAGALLGIGAFTLILLGLFKGVKRARLDEADRLP